MLVGVFQRSLSFSPADFSHKSFKDRKISSTFQPNIVRFPSKFDPETKKIAIVEPSQLVSASASSVGGSSADYPEQLLDAQKKKKRKLIAGIDQDELLDPANLADPDSCFCEFNGVQIHHKVYNVESKASETLETKKIGFPMILLHGFGASVFSWNRVMKPLADVTGSKILAFDRPAFGLTSRLSLSEISASFKGDARPLNPYSMAFSVLATLYFIGFLGAEKAILVGHSAGSLVAVNAYLEAPERVAALILVAPALLAPRAVHKVEKNKLERDNWTEDDSSSTNSLGNPLIQFLNTVSKFAKMIVQAILGMVKGMTDVLNSLYKRFFSAFLRSTLGVMLVRIIIDKFGIAAVRNAWYNPNQVDEHVLTGYTKPLRTKGWDRALVEYTAAMLADTSSESKPPLTKRLHEISCPVLIVTGDTDRLVPSWNSKRLSRAIPGSQFEVIKHCGHLPHEEKVDEFVSIVQRFLQRAFGDAEEQNLQVVV
ncbi:hypothetical protein UlMin_026260 [Ulmus minor]